MCTGDAKQTTTTIRSLLPAETAFVPAPAFPFFFFCRVSLLFFCHPDLRLPKRRRSFRGRANVFVRVGFPEGARGKIEDLESFQTLASIFSRYPMLLRVLWCAVLAVAGRGTRLFFSFGCFHPWSQILLVGAGNAPGFKRVGRFFSGWPGFSRCATRQDSSPPSSVRRSQPDALPAGEQILFCCCLGRGVRCRMRRSSKHAATSRNVSFTSGFLIHDHR